MTRGIWYYFTTAVAAGIATLVKDSIGSAEGAPALEYGVPIAAGVATFVALNGIRYGAERGLRWNARFAMVGTWVERFDSTGIDRYSLFEIRHRFLANTFHIVGHTYNTATHEPFANWHSIAVTFPEENTLYYLHKSVIHGRTDVSGVTRLNFAGSGRVLYEGTGYLIDNDEPLQRLDFSIERLQKDKVKSITGKSRLESRADRVKLFEALAGTDRRRDEDRQA